MDRFENLRIASVDNNESSVNLLNDVRANERPPRLPDNNYNKIEAQEIAAHFDQSKNEGRVSESMDDGALRLARNLMPLASDMPAYNAMLKDLQEGMKAIPTGDYPSSAELKLESFDEKSGTYKNAYIYINADSFDSHEAYRIVPPGNTLSQIAKDSYDEKVKSNEGQPLGYSLSDFQAFIIEKNGIINPDDIKVGDVLKMYVF